MNRDIRLAHKLWTLTQSDFAWQALCELVKEQAEKEFRQARQAGKYKKVKLDDFKIKKIVFLRTATLLSELDRRN